MRTSWHDDRNTRVASGSPPVPRGAAEAPAANDVRSLTTTLVVEILAGVCGIVLTAVFDGSPRTRLIGAFVGIVVAALLTVNGPFVNVRATAAVGITILAVLLTFGGAKAVEEAGGPEIIGTAGPRATPTSATPVPTTSKGTIGPNCEGSLCIQVTPRQVACTAESCPPVVVSNPGSRSLRIGAVEITGGAAKGFRRDDGCAGRTLGTGQNCTIKLAYEGALSGKATLVIHQNLDGPASRVALTAVGIPASPSVPPKPGPDLYLSAANLRCSVVRRGSLSGADGLTVFIAVLDKGTAPYQHLVPFSLSSDTGLKGGGNSGISDGTAATGMQADLRPSDYGRIHHLVATVDPQHEIAEENEQNNRLDIRLSLGARPTEWADQPCRVLP
ncbi:hypothetical protein ACQP2Y_12700 [Actinoplanes sp. CA-051413]|uniref:hypothetical protein n=1 Tax=Actinoplanes sp. CA-051413 TaxID=3239899 RepID=UPI003D99B36B